MAIREFFHLIHIVHDEDEVDAFYNDLFAPQYFAKKGWLEHERRWASLGMIGNFMLEVIEPSDKPEDQGFALSKFRNRFGQHLHSLAWYVEGGMVKPLFDSLRAKGIRIAKPGGGMFPDGDIDPGATMFTHPKDTFGQLEFVDVTNHWLDTDPRFQPGWDTSYWADEHPLTIQRVSHFTTLVRDLDRARELFVEALDGTVLHTATTPEAESVFVLVGNETVVELARPVAPNSRLAADLEANGELPHSTTFTVRDLGSAAQHAEKLGIGILDRSDTGFTLDPADCFNAVWSFTTEAVPGDPRA